MTRNINISFVTDDNYFNYMIIAIDSIISNNLSGSNLSFYILDAGIDKENINKFKLKYKDIKFNFIEINSEDVSSFDIKTHVSKAAFAKIYMPELLKIDKVIYLDCDLILNEDISNLWCEFEDGIALKAVWNPFYNYDNEYLGIDDTKKTFNSGVMLMDLNIMREYKSSHQLKQFLCNYNKKTKLHDQAAFNAVFKNKWKELPLKWNVQVSMLCNTYKKLGLEKNMYFNLYKHPGIIHFTSNSKPWQLRNSHPYKKIYKSISRNSIVKIKYTDLNILSILKKVREILIYKYYYLVNLF